MSLHPPSPVANLSLKTRKFPACFKSVQVLPLLKKAGLNRSLPVKSTTGQYITYRQSPRCLRDLCWHVCVPTSPTPQTSASDSRHSSLKYLKTFSQQIQAAVLFTRHFCVRSITGAKLSKRCQSVSQKHRHQCRSVSGFYSEHFGTNAEMCRVRSVRTPWRRRGIHSATYRTIRRQTNSRSVKSRTG